MADESKLTATDHINKKMLASFKTHLDATKPIVPTENINDSGEWSDDENAARQYAQEVNEPNPENMLTEGTATAAAATTTTTATTTTATRVTNGNDDDDDDDDDKLPSLEARN